MQDTDQNIHEKFGRRPFSSSFFQHSMFTEKNVKFQSFINEFILRKRPLQKKDDFFKGFKNPSYYKNSIIRPSLFPLESSAETIIVFSDNHPARESL